MCRSNYIDDLKDDIEEMDMHQEQRQMIFNACKAQIRKKKEESKRIEKIKKELK